MEIGALPVTVVSFLGLLCGLAGAVLCSVAWIGLAGAAQEWLTETLIDRGRGEAHHRTRALRDGPQEVLVSDLHIDTWDYPGGAAGPRAAAFLGFLTAVRQAPNVHGFLLNGDLMDIPLFAGGLSPQENRLMLPVGGEPPVEQGILARRYEPILKSLLSLGTTLPGVQRTVFQTGNHDIGINGLRYVQPEMPPFLPPVQIGWNPQILLRGGPAPDSSYRHPVYIEHGHYFDPFLWLYMRYAFLDVLRGGHQRQEMQWIAGMQRGGRKGMGRQSRRGITSPEGEKAPKQAPERSDPTSWHFQDEARARSFGEKVVQYRFRQAARRVFRDLRRRGKRTITEASHTVTFGHTHLPDRYVFPDGSVYVNSGDWCGNTPHQCYCVIQADGTVRGPFQWNPNVLPEFGPPSAPD